MRHRFIPALALVGVLAMHARAQVEASGFGETTVAAGLDGPTAVAFLPDGRMLVAEFSGALRLIEDGVARTVFQVPDLAYCSTASYETGLLGLAVDPDFATTRHVFLYRTRRGGAGPCGGSGTGRVNEVIRVALGRDDVGDGASLAVLLTGIGTDTGYHNGGCLRFGPDGKLYVGTGDTGSGDFNGQGPGAQTNPYAQDLGRLEGKILRIEKDGLVPRDNPFVARPGARGEVFAYGFRNPFRFGFDPVAGRLWVGDVGENDVEEIDVVAAGDDHGWPRCEGDLPRGCAAGAAVPAFTYTHPVRGGASVTGGGFAPQGFGELGGRYFFGDYESGEIFHLEPNPLRDGVVGGATRFADDAGGPVDLVFGPDGALYIVSLHRGNVRRIAALSGGEQRLAGRRITLRDGRRKLSFLSKDDVTLGGAADDPTVHGATLRVALDADAATYPLPAGGWTEIRNGKGLLRGFRYRDRDRLFGPIRRLNVRAGRDIFASGAGEGLGHALGDTAPVSVRVTLTLGGRGYCAEFGAPDRFRAGRVYRARRSDPPSACDDSGD